MHACIYIYVYICITAMTNLASIVFALQMPLNLSQLSFDYIKLMGA